MMLEFRAQSPDNATFARSDDLLKQWQELIDDLDESDVSVVPFCLTHLFPRLNISSDQVPEYIQNSRLLHVIAHNQREDIVGGTVELPRQVAGQDYSDESGELVDMDGVVAKGIDPNKVLVFRIAPPTDVSRSQLYWQTDVEAPISMYELSDQQKNESVILVSTLAAIASTNDGIVFDLMDNNGLSFRQVGAGVFPNESIICSIPFRELF